ncbi:hypothetical protein ERHA55_14870 [Erwinia rhapontici]|nr:hypothetical protein ERHA55_14870 [Erwinia rhapontici]
MFKTNGAKITDNLKPHFFMQIKRAGIALAIADNRQHLAVWTLLTADDQRGQQGAADAPPPISASI